MGKEREGESRGGETRVVLVALGVSLALSGQSDPAEH